MFVNLLIFVAAAAPLVLLLALLRMMTRPPAQSPAPTAAAPGLPLFDGATTQLLLDALPHPIVLFSPDHQLLRSNRAAQSLFQLTPGALAESVPHKWLLPLLSEVTATGRPVDPPGYQAAVQVFADNRELLFHPRAEPLLNADGSLRGIALLLIDATGLRQVDEAKSGLLSTVSHELKTPLTSLQMAIHLLIDDQGAPLSPRRRDLLLTARDDADRLNALIDDLLDVGRLRSGKAPLLMEPLPAAALVESAGSSLRRDLEEKRLTLQTDLPESLPPVRADPTRAAYVVATLLTVARRAARHEGCIHIGAALDNARLSLLISVPNDHLDPLFAHPDSPSGRDGVSLAVAREIAAAHDGAIAFSSEPGGPQWRFTLPLAS